MKDVSVQHHTLTQGLDRVLGLEEIAERSGTPVNTLRYWRHLGLGGPPTFKIGRRVVAMESDVEAWIADARRGERAGV